MSAKLASLCIDGWYLPDPVSNQIPIRQDKSAILVPENITRSQRLRCKFHNSVNHRTVEQTNEK